MRQRVRAGVRNGLERKREGKRGSVTGMQTHRVKIDLPQRRGGGGGGVGE